MIPAAFSDKILSIDIGGTLIKATMLSSEGELLADYKMVKTPKPADPAILVNAIKETIKEFSGYNKISVGFPGYVKDGIIHTCPQLGTSVFAGFNLRGKLQEELSVPVRMINDADLQGLGVARGKGFEMVITLGTGLGSALLFNGVLLPHLELSQHPMTNNLIYDHYIGAKALEEKGEAGWNERVKKMLAVFKIVFNYDHLYIGGGNACKINFGLDENITIVTNKDGIKGGARLWK